MKKVVSLVLCVLMLMSMVTFAGAAESLDGLTVEDLTTQAPKAITTNLTLPATFNENPITWSSSNPNIIAADGTVTRPVEDTDVTLTASLVSDTSVTKEINLTVAGLATKVFVSENHSSGTSNWVAETTYGVSVNNVADSATGNNYLQINSNTSGSYKGATYTFDTDNQPSGDVVFKTRVFFDDISTAKVDGRRFRFNTDVVTDAAEVLFSWTSAKRISFGSAGTSNAEFMDMSSYFTINSDNSVDWFDLTVSFDFATNRYTVTVQSEGKTKLEKTFNLKSATGSDSSTVPHNANSKLKSVKFEYREPTAENTAYSGLDDLVVTSSGIEGATAAERLAVYKSVVQNGFNSGADNRFVVGDINLASIPTFDGYTISWASSDESVLKVSDNVATIQGFKEIGRPVTLTATLTHEGETATIPFDVTVHPAGTTSEYNGTAKILDFEDCTANAVLSDEYKAGAGSWLVSNAGDKVVYDSARNSNVLETTGKFQYGKDSYQSGMKANALFRTVSADLYIDKPADFVDGRFAMTVRLANTSLLAYIRYYYKVDESGNVSDESYTEISNGSVNKTIHSVPELGKWFNLKIVLNKTSDTYDVYYDGKRVAETAFKMVTAGSMSYLYKITIQDDPLTGTSTIAAATTKKVDNIYMTYSNADWTAVHADLALANADDWSNLLTTGVNGSAITWELKSDDATLTDGDGVKIFAPNEGLGKGTAVLTATSGNQSRTYTLNFDLINPVVINGVTYANEATELAAGVTIESVTVSTDEEAAKGYVAIFDGSRVDTIKTFDITAGTDVDHSIGLTVGSNLTNPKLKIFAWSNILKPLSEVFSK